MFVLTVLNTSQYSVSRLFPVPAEEHATQRREQAAEGADMELRSDHRAGGGQEPARHGRGDQIQ